MFSCITLSFSALPFQRAVRLAALREFERVDVDCYTGSTHVPAPAIAMDPRAVPKRSLELAARGMRPLVAIAHEGSLPLQIEPHLDSVADTPDRARTLVDLVPGLQLTLDYSHFLAQGYTPDAIHPLLPLAGHVHARHAAWTLQTPAAASELDFDDIYRRLRVCGYDGDLCLESPPGGGWGAARNRSRSPTNSDTTATCRAAELVIDVIASADAHIAYRRLLDAPEEHMAVIIDWTQR